jgi:hypothetical protein
VESMQIARYMNMIVSQYNRSDMLFNYIHNEYIFLFFRRSTILQYVLALAATKAVLCHIAVQINVAVVKSIW